MTSGAPSVGGGRTLAAALLALLVAALVGLPTPAGAATAPTNPAPATALTNPDPAATPPMGWDSWDAFGCSVTQHDVVQAADWLVATGLRDAGYRYVIVDDCWYNPTRAPDGSLRGNASKFPNGMRWLGWYLHSHGLRFGLYASAGQSTCAQLNGIYPGSTGSLGHEQQDARTFASWGVDYLKYDYCSPDGSVWDQIAAFTTMRDALEATGRRIVYSINPNSFHVATGARNWGAVANDVRVGEDLAPVWDMGPLSYWYFGIVNAIAADAPLWPRAKPGIWNDPDSLVVGLQPTQFATAVHSPSFAALFDAPTPPLHQHLSLEAMRTNFAMWAMLAAPLVIGADVPTLTPPELRILLNPRLIALDQDPLGRQGHPLSHNEQVWVKPLSGGAVAVALFNSNAAPLRIATDARRVGLRWAAGYQLTNLWTGARATTKGALSAAVPAHGTAVFELAPIAGSRSSPRAPRQPA
jgi:alpha-galactosidase